MAIDLGKKISLVKDVLRTNRLDKKGQVAIVVDISISMRSYFQNGTVQELVERALAIGINMDLDEQVDVYLFGHSAHRAASATLSNIEGYVNKEILGKYDLEGGTNYAPVTRMVAQDAGHLDGADGKKNIISRLFSKSKPVRKEPTYVFFVTDGENHDPQQMTPLVKELSSKPIFLQFIGIGNASFNYLEKLDEMPGRTVDNANFFDAGDIARITDEELYQRILGELPDWVQEATAKGIIK